MDVDGLWQDLDPTDPPRLLFTTPVPGNRVVLLLGAFDPPTRAHVALLRGAARRLRIPGAYCLTKVLLDRRGSLLPPATRLRLLGEVAAPDGHGVAACNRGTYLEADQAARDCGMDAVFLIGSDKLPQLADPVFYTDGARGVASTFAQVRFLVVPRGVPVGRADVEVLAAEEVFDSEADAGLSATAVRERLALGEDVEDAVPPAVALALQRYTLEGRAK